MKISRYRNEMKYFITCGEEKGFLKFGITFKRQLSEEFLFKIRLWYVFYHHVGGAEVLENWIAKCEGRREETVSQHLFH